jgi:hypothetical protein
MPIYVSPGRGAPIVSAPGAAPLESLGITYVSQRPQANWCWATCCTMVASHLKVTDPCLGGPTQKCHLASVVFQKQSCCDNPGDCDDGAWPEPAYDHLGISYDPDVPSPPFNSQTVLTLEQIADEVLNKRRPVEVLYKWSTRGSHVVLITGVYASGELEVLDPWFGVESPVTYDYVRTARGLGRWEGTYRGFDVATAAAAPAARAAKAATKRSKS